MYFRLAVNDVYFITSLEVFALEANSGMYLECDVNLSEWMFEFLHFHSAHLNGCGMLCPAV